jgi:N-acetyl-gamma-glutamyl-phosphate reductase
MFMHNMRVMALTAKVLGASGFAGGEIGRILCGHPAIAVVAAGAGAHAGRPWAGVHPQLAGVADLELVTVETALAVDADVCFSCLPSATLAALAAGEEARLIVDLSADFRADEGWVYGLTELVRPELKDADRVSNPGCYPTASLLALVPFARMGVIEGPVIIDAISGVSGAGRRLEDRLLFAGIDGNATAYGTVEHRHVPEIERGLEMFGGLRTTVSFTPHLAPMSRGLLVTARAKVTSPLDDDDARSILDDAYAFEPFVRVISEWPATKPVGGSNAAHVSARVDQRNGLLVCAAAIDNLGKGAAGQAVQNANAALGLDETTGLGTVGIWP